MRGRAACREGGEGARKGGKVDAGGAWSYRRQPNMSSRSCMTASAGGGRGSAVIGDGLRGPAASRSIAANRASGAAVGAWLSGRGCRTAVGAWLDSEDPSLYNPPRSPPAVAGPAPR